jgi:hypothetical protein
MSAFCDYLGTFYVNDRLKGLLFEELQQVCQEQCILPTQTNELYSCKPYRKKSYLVLLAHRPLYTPLHNYPCR